MIVKGEKYTLYLGDCLDIMPTLAAGTVDAVITDPPYGISMARGMGVGGGGLIPRKKGKGVSAYSGSWDKERPCKSVFDLIFSYKSPVIIFGGNYFADILPKSTKWLVWDKLNTMPSYSDYELIYTHGIKGNAIKGYTQSTNGLLAEEKNRVHPTQKPIRLLTEIISDFTAESGTILDPFMGSGSTGVAAAKTGRHFIGIEKDPEYFEIACERVKNAYGDFVVTSNEKQAGMIPLFGSMS